MTEEGPAGRNFSQQRARSRSFRKQDLSGADFSHADIRGVDFTAANLTDASFRCAIAGSRPWAIKLVTVLSMLCCALLGLFSILVADTVNTDYFRVYGPKDAILVCSAVFLFMVSFVRLRSLVAAALVNVLTILVVWLLLVMADFYQTKDLLYGLVDEHSLAVDSSTLLTAFFAGSVIVMTFSSVTLAGLRMKTGSQR